MENLPARRQAPTQLTRYDAKSAEALFGAYGGRLYAYFRLMLANEAAAKRALADTLMTAAADPGWPRDPGQHVPRLFALAHAECHKYQSADAVGAGRHWIVTDWTHGGHWPGLSEVARQAVSRLSPDVREAFILSAPHNHLSLPQLAGVLGVGLDAAADLRAQAGLDFVRAVQSCAHEADFTEFSGSDLRIRAEESLARDASEPPPSLPVLSDPALAVFEENAGPRSAPASGPWTSASPTVTDFPSAPLEYRGHADPPRQASFHAHPGVREPDYLEEEDFPGEANLMGRPPAPGDGIESGSVADSTLHDVLPGGPEFGGPEFPTEPGLPLVRERPRRRRRAALAWAGGGIAVAAAVAVGWNALLSGPGNSLTLAPGGPSPSGAVSPRSGLGPPTVSPRHGQPRHRPSGAADPAASAGTSPDSGSQSAGGTAPAQAVPQPAPRSPAPVHATTAPAPVPTKSKAKPTTSASTSPAAPSSPATSPPASSAAS